jgi:hypothetical protein
MGVIFSYAVKVGLGTVIYVASFIKVGSGVQKLTVGGYIQTHTNKHKRRATRSHKLTPFFQKKEGRLETKRLSILLLLRVYSLPR